MPLNTSLEDITPKYAYQNDNFIQNLKKKILYSNIKLKVSNIHGFWRFFLFMIHSIFIANCIKTEVI